MQSPRFFLIHTRWAWKITCLLACILSVWGCLQAQDTTFKVFLVGDAGEDPLSGKTLQRLGVALKESPNSAVLFLGDNAYKNALGGILPYGFKGFDSSTLSKEKVRSQLDILSGYKGHVFFIPGNHDWWNKTNYEKGKKKLAMEAAFIRQNLAANNTIANPGNNFLPADGGPGPAYVDLDNNRLRIIFIDTYRLIIDTYEDAKGPETALEKSFYPKLDSLLAEATRNQQRIIVAAHHPLYTEGPYTDHLKHPYLFGRIKASNMTFPSYARMVTKMRALLAKYPGIYYVSGHVHSLLYFLPPDHIHYIVSGAGSKNVKVSAKEIEKMPAPQGPAYMTWNNKGFFELQFSNQDVHLIMHLDDAEHTREIDQKDL